ncbi:23S rRNA (uracil(1939)-C(5))-methyltransferase RlmD [Mailhella massiliensis]|uniref:23S rRNA (Uracil(1939)-C(5))-methyltransferase RlmD n=1 Tax=Mailhella massiliensis TaxID=1903261 RepID=A0A921AV20_9BACT|nr:23S rRNA (uracil(1939)-C(5))-methyltransferase RlmD [Mailhella massiliensis]HJD96668.1 23S rRNA (uracil(1939)-C(5))-methyltransferase RlmD [Mailhella massiliensis]
MEYHTGDTLELELAGLSSDGRAVGRSVEGMTVFVRGGLPGQKVAARLTAVKKRMAEAEVEEILQRAREERPAPCVHAANCGGCPWQSLAYPLQLEWKRRIVQDSLQRIGRLALPEEIIMPVLSCGEEAQWTYRNKMEFAFAESREGKTLLGLRERSSHSVTEVTGCLLQSRRAMAVLQALRELCDKYRLHAASSQRGGRRPRHGSFSRSVRQNDILRFAVIREPLAGGCLVELITLPSPQENSTLRKLGQELLACPHGVTGFVHSIRRNESDVAYGEETAFTLGEAQLSETLHLQGREVAFRLDHNSFFQVNSRAAELLYNSAAKLASALFSAEEDRLWGESCWDIYCGAGGLALTMAPHFQHIFGLEAVAQAVELARENARIAGGETTFRFEAGDAATLERRFSRMGIPDLLVTDPPRAGMDERTVQAILRHRPPRVILVSCNPATLARDLALLAPAYHLRAVQPVDIFPQTPHVETVAALEVKSLL